jgi:hypothetical protein
MAATQGRSGHRLQVNVATTLGATMPQAAWNLQCGATRAKGRSATAAALVAIICGVASASTVRNRCADKTSHDSVRSPLPALAAGLVDGHRGGSATACRSRRTPCRSQRACSRYARARFTRCVEALTSRVASPDSNAVISGAPIVSGCEQRAHHGGYCRRGTRLGRATRAPDLGVLLRRHEARQVDDEAVWNGVCLKRYAITAAQVSAGAGGGGEDG